jgi:hypothetical protein
MASSVIEGARVVKVLMLESHDGVARDAEAELTRAGHTIVRCSTPDRQFPCRALSMVGDCPLDQYVDVAVVVQEIGTEQVDLGALCVLRCRIPVVEVNPTHSSRRWSSPLWTSVTGHDLMAECQRAAHDGDAHAQAVRRRLIAQGVLAEADLEGPAPTVAIGLQRSAARLQLTIELDDRVRHREAEITRAATQALREYDARAAVIDIVVRRRESVEAVPRGVVAFRS